MNDYLGVAWLLGLSSSLAFPLEKTTAQEIVQQAARPADGARKVVAAVVVVAERNASLSNRRKGDELTEFYIRAAAESALRLPEEHRVSAFLIGLGVALDDSEVLRKNPVTAGLCRNIESDAERKKRLAVLGSPTMRGRRDLCQHFVVSCTLTQVLGEALAESAGLLKEQKDMQSGTGFSFADMQANLSGIALATALRKQTLSLETLAKQFRVADYLPEHTGLREGLSEEQFTREYGSFSDKRFLAEIKRLRERVGNTRKEER